MLEKLFSLLCKIFKRKNECFYINSNNLLPPPLEEEVERELLCKVQQGDNEARNTLIVHNLRLVVFIAKKFESTKINLEDLVSIGSMGLIKGVQTFKMEKNIKLATYASRCIENEILMHIRKISNQKTEVSLEEPINMDGEGNELLLSDILGTDEDVVFRGLEEDVDILCLRQALSRLPDREKEIVTMRYGLDGKAPQTAQEVGRKLNLTVSEVVELETAALNKMRKSGE